MSRNKKIIIAVLALVVIASAAGYAWWSRRSTAPTVTVETIRTRDLEALVSASGKIQPKRFVNISADTSGRVVDLAVNEGDRVSVGQFLMQIDPRTLRTRVESGQAALQANQAALEQSRQAVETARVQLTVAQQNHKRQQELWKQQLTPREALEQPKTICVSRNRRWLNAKSRCAHRKCGSVKIARSSPARSSISARCASNRQSPASSPAVTYKKVKRRSSGR